MNASLRTRIIHRSTLVPMLLAAAWAVPVSAQQAAATSPSTVRYVAQLSALNSAAAGGSATGEATFTITGDSLTITVTASGLPKDITHWQHFHGFPEGQPAACPNASSDVNHDGIIDIVETEPAAGTTMVPLTDNPAGMDVAHGIYPKASATGTLQYTQTVSLAELQAAFGKAFPGKSLDLDRRVVFLHGVPSTTVLPATVASLGPIPAAVTLPIACGRIALAE